jgi:hypothetical protein
MQHGVDLAPRPCSRKRFFAVQQSRPTPSGGGDATKHVTFPYKKGR